MSRLVYIARLWSFLRKKDTLLAVVAFRFQDLNDLGVHSAMTRCCSKAAVNDVTGFIWLSYFCSARDTLTTTEAA